MAAGVALSIRESFAERGRSKQAEALMQSVFDAIPNAGNEMRLARHRYHLALAAIEHEDLETARRHLEGVTRLLDHWANYLDGLDPTWRSIYDSERHLNHVGWGQYHCARGAIDDAYRELTASRKPYEAALAWGHEGVSKIRPVTQAQLEIDVALAAGRYRRALELANEAIGRLSHVASEHNLNILTRRRAVAESELALQGDGDPALVIDALERSLAYPNLDPDSRLDAEYRLCQSLAQLGRVEEAREIATSIDRDSLRGFDRAMATAMLVDTAKIEDLPQQLEELRVDLAGATAEWLDFPPAPGGTGRLQVDKVRYMVRAVTHAELTLDPNAHARALDHVLQVLDAHDLARRMGAASVRSTELCKSLLPGEAGLLFLTSDRGGYGFLISHAGVESFPIGGTKAVQTAANELTAAALDPSGESGEWRATAQRLADVLLPPQILDALASADTVLVFASDTVYEAPLGLVEVAGEPLALRSAMAQIPSPAILPALRGRAAPPWTGATIVANVPAKGWVDPLDRSFPSIELTNDDLGRWVAWTGDETQLLRGIEGSVEAVLGGSFGERALGVVFAHGDVVPDLGRPSGLLLGGNGGAFGNGRLSARDVEALGAADVMLLATCRAGRGPTRIGSGGSNHMGSAFLLAGTRCVVLSANDLPARATAALTELILEGLARGASMGIALRDAKRRIQGRDGLDHPSIWGALTVFGLPEVTVALPLPQESPTFAVPTPMILGALLALVAAGLVWRRSSRSGLGTES